MLAEALRISTSQVLSTGGETAPDVTNGGITINKVLMMVTSLLLNLLMLHTVLLL